MQEIHGLVFALHKTELFNVSELHGIVPLTPAHEKVSHTEFVKLKGCLFMGIILGVEGWVTHMLRACKGGHSLAPGKDSLVAARKRSTG